MPEATLPKVADLLDFRRNAGRGRVHPCTKTVKDCRKGGSQWDADIPSE